MSDDRLLPLPDRPFAVGDRVGVHAMCGMDAGEVVKVGRKWIHVAWRGGPPDGWIKQHLPEWLHHV